MSDTNESKCGQPGAFSWNELMSANPQASAEFYGQLFGWQATPFVPPGAPAGGPPYTLFKTDANPMGVGGMLPTPAPGLPTQWVPYVVVANVETALARAVELGAKAMTRVIFLGQVGRIAIIQDPQGATLGLHEPAK